MILRRHTLPDGRVATLERTTWGYTTRLSREGAVIVGKDWSPKSRDKALARFVELCTASPDVSALYGEALDVVHRAAAGLPVARQRSLADGVLSDVLQSNERGAAPALRGLLRLADETGDPTVRRLAARVEGMHGAALLALPEAVRAPLADTAPIRGGAASPAPAPGAHADAVPRRIAATPTAPGDPTP
ncbi:MAG: hypothetical protein Q8S73_43140 [Deltaproteobacteria bacterium]|nr:hypothetical protein [Myxococcales bacterium]MDP3220959.1 hypothetical protein [Deltaproteobacteria bacterium]